VRWYLWRPVAAPKRGQTSTAKGPASARASRPAAPGARVRTTMATATAGHGRDLAGLAAIGLGLVTALGIYADLAGPVGRAARWLAAVAVGQGKFLVPVVLVVVGVWLIRSAHSNDDTLVTSDHGPARFTVGGLLLTIAGLGLLHLGRGAPAFSGPEALVARAGGYLGAGIGVPAKGLLGSLAATVVLVFVGLAGVLLITHVSLKAVAGRTAAGVRPVGGALRRSVGSLFRVSSDTAPTQEAPLEGTGENDTGDNGAPGWSADATRRLPEGDEPTVVVFDQDAFDAAAAPPTEPAPSAGEEARTEQLEISLGPGARRSPWKLPPAKLLNRTGSQQVDRALVEETGHNLERALAQHGVETRLIGMVVGPTVTRYELELGPGVKVSRVTSLHKDIAYSMATPDVRILAPIPGKQAIGVEIPNVRKQLVTVGDILSSEEARHATHPLEVAIGRDISGKSVLANLATMPHLLIAGATGAGKSSCINSLLTSVLMRSTPDQVRMILVDPKRVELGQYNRLPHLLTEVVTNPKRAANALAWAVREMERRYDLLAEVGFRDVTGYNAAFDRGELDHDEGAAVLGASADACEPRYRRLPFILVVVDELNDLMMVAARDVEDSICRIAQMARAVGIHLVIATQRPSVNVITGVIKANIPSRLAFAVSSLADSRVILDQPGAERLLGRGDMLLLGATSSAAQRIQGSWVTEDEVRAVVGHWRRQAPEIAYDTQVQGTDDAGSLTVEAVGGTGAGDDDDETLVLQAMDLVVRSQLGSTSMLQRKLRVGFARAGRLMDLLEQRGVVGPSEGSKARAVLMTVDELADPAGAPDGSTRAVTVPDNEPF